MTEMIIPNFRLPMGVVAGVSPSVFTSVHIYREKRNILFSLSLTPFLDFGSGIVPVGNVEVVNDVVLPVNRSDCYGPPNCKANCNHCLEGDDGWVCYKCPSTCSGPAHPICGNDIGTLALVTYDSECAMRQIACENNTALRIVYPGSCSLESPTQLTVLPSWPTLLQNPPLETQQFIRYAVVFLVVSVSGNSEFNYSRIYFSSGLSEVLSYDVTVPEITNSSKGTHSHVAQAVMHDVIN
jgi:hypothetical protein